MTGFTSQRWLPTPAVLAALLAVGCAAGPEPRLKAGERYATIYTGGRQPAEGIFPVVLYNIDGEEIVAEGEFHRLPPGRHTLRGRGLVERNWVSGPTRARSGDREPNVPLTAWFESGTRYFVGLKADTPTEGRWSLVIWRVEETDQGVLGFDDEGR